MIHAYLIDPVKKQVTQVEFNKNLNELTECETCTAVKISHKDDYVFIDDEGLFVEDQKFFYIVREDMNLSKSVMLAGKGLVLGTDDEGESINPSMSLEKLKKRIFWANPVEAEAERDRILDRGPEIVMFDSHEELLAFLEEKRREANE